MTKKIKNHTLIYQRRKYIIKFCLVSRQLRQSIHCSNAYLNTISNSRMSQGNVEELRSPETEFEELVLIYQGLDGLVRSSRIQFLSRQPDYFIGNTAIWHMELNPHQTIIHLGYRVQLLVNSNSISKVGEPMTLMPAKAAESMELQEWQQQVITIRSDSNTFNYLN
jgi:hypothetical protein